MIQEHHIAYYTDNSPHMHPEGCFTNALKKEFWILLQRSWDETQLWDCFPLSEFSKEEGMGQQGDYKPAEKGDGYDSNAHLWSPTALSLSLHKDYTVPGGLPWLAGKGVAAVLLYTPFWPRMRCQKVKKWRWTGILSRCGHHLSQHQVAPSHIMLQGSLSMHPLPATPLLTKWGFLFLTEDELWTQP